MPNRRTIAACVLTAALCFALGLYVARAGAAGMSGPARLTYSGYLEEPDGTPVSGDKPIALAFYDAAASGKKLGCEISSEPLTHVDRGRFQVPLPDTCVGAIQSTVDIWVDVQVDGLSVGRSKLGVVPYAVEAAHAISATSATSASGALDQRIAAIDQRLAGVEKQALTQVQSGSIGVSTSGDNPTAGCEILRQLSAGTRSCSRQVSFASPFSAPPQVSAGIVSLDEGTADGHTRITVSVSAVTTTGFTVTFGTWYTANDVTSVAIQWIAVGR